MATVYRCDRCKTIGEPPDFLTPVLVPGSAGVAEKGEVTVAPVDQLNLGLCQDCLTKLRSFMEAA